MSGQFYSIVLVTYKATLWYRSRVTVSVRRLATWRHASCLEHERPEELRVKEWTPINIFKLWVGKFWELRLTHRIGRSKQDLVSNQSIMRAYGLNAAIFPSIWCTYITSWCNVQKWGKRACFWNRVDSKSSLSAIKCCRLITLWEWWIVHALFQICELFETVKRTLSIRCIFFV